MKEAKLIQRLAPLVVAALISGCYDPPISEERLQQSIVVTTHDDGADFGAFTTFYVRPEIRVLDEDTTNADTVDDESVLPEFMPDSAAAPLIAATRQSMIDRGYREARGVADAELGLELVYVRAVYSDYFCYYW